MEKSKQFYKVVADFGANVTLDGGVVLQTLDTWKSFIRTDNVVLPNKAVELYFEEDDMDAFCNHLKSFTISYVHELFEHRWGQRVVRFYDPDKHMVEVREKLDAVALRFVEQGHEFFPVSTCFQRCICKLSLCKLSRNKFIL